MSSNAKVVWDSAALNRVRSGYLRGMVKMGNAMANRAKTNAPYLTGALRNSIRVVQDGDYTVYVTAGGQAGRMKVDYAKLREFENFKNPSTTYYMTRAFNTVVSGNINQYFTGELTK